jgi:hypothetical protein
MNRIAAPARTIVTVALTAILLPVSTASSASLPGYQLTTPAGWLATRSEAGVQFSRRATDGARVVVQLRMPVADEFTLPRVVSDVLASIEAVDGITDPIGGPVVTETVGGVMHSFVTRSYRDRDGLPVFLYVCAIRTGTAIGVVQAESRSSAAFNELAPDVAALITSMRVDGWTSNTSIGGSLLTQPPRHRTSRSGISTPGNAPGPDNRAPRRPRMT